MTALQDAAADPRASVFVSASAGTGKTHVLTNRVLRLLLELGVAPEKILCLTYTKAAAAEMANRIQDRLAAWAVEPEARLAAAIRDLTGDIPEAETLVRARRLFARVLDAPGGLRIETIHAFCQSLLGRFPVEVGLPPRFEALDDEAAALLKAEATDDVLRDPAYADEVQRLSGLVSDMGFEKLVGGFIALRTRLPEDLGPATMARHLEELARLLDRPPGVETGRTAVVARFAETRQRFAGKWEAAIAALRQGSATDQKAAAALAACRARFDHDAYAAVFLTSTGEPRKSPMTKKLAERFPDEAEWMQGEARDLVALEAEATAADVHMASRALLVIGTAILDRYTRAKGRRRAIDFDDMVLKARDLLTRGAAAPWVLFKLDGGIDHLLIDEAQDTSPAQWQLVRALTDEFFAHQAGTGRHRTVFAVGDVKQSIYSFQGAAPELFGAERERIGGAVAAAGQSFRPIELDTSFRTAPAVLALVDAVFARDEAQAGVVEGERLRHRPHRAGAAGRIELWPVEDGETVEDGEAWSPAEVAARGRSAEHALAERIATRIRADLDAGAILPARGRAMRPGDIMVLVRRRTGFVEALTRACKARGVPVAGSDRMSLAAQLGVRDLIAMGRFALMPDDDLTLAAVLKGPFLGLTEEALFDLAHDRGPARLWRRLVARAGERADFAAAQGLLAGVLARADFETPFSFFSRLLGEAGGRRRLIGRLGAEAIEPIEEFLSHALRHEADEAPSLERFLHEVESGATELKRDLDRGRDEVRILTVHASKGLEAPVVILPDTTGLPGAREDLLVTEGGLPLFAVAGASVVPAVARLRDSLKAAALREYRRLLYVALTRAEDHLIVCGWRGGRKKDQPFEDGSWYALVAAAFPEDAAEVEQAPGFAIRRKDGVQSDPVGERGHRASAGAQPLPLPEWALSPAPAERRPSDPLSPSRLADADLGVASPLALAGPRRFLRGRLVHRLLELLPDLPAAEWPAAAGRFLEARADGLDAEGREALAAETLAVLRHAEFGAVFGPGSRPEVPVAALLGEISVLGQVDRLVVLPERVLIVDFKTDRPSPDDWRRVAGGYLRQLALYRAAVARLFPGKPVEAALLWTETPRLMPIPGEALDASLADLPGFAPAVDASPRPS